MPVSSDESKRAARGQVFTTSRFEATRPKPRRCKTTCINNPANLSENIFYFYETAEDGLNGGMTVTDFAVLQLLATTFRWWSAGYRDLLAGFSRLVRPQPFPAEMAKADTSRLKPASWQPGIYAPPPEGGGKQHQIRSCTQEAGARDAVGAAPH
jgi:hypothetical protein